MNVREALCMPGQIWLAVEPVDMRLGIDGLTARIQRTLGRFPADGGACAFSNRRRNRLKLLLWDGNGVWLAQRRLHRGRFTWPEAGEDSVELSEEEWRWLISGVDWRRAQARIPALWQV